MNRNNARFCNACGAPFPAAASRGITPPPATIIEAMKRNDLRAVKKFIDQGDQVRRADDEGYTPLHWAAEYGHIKLVDALIRKGADVGAMTWDGWTPLDLARVEAHDGVEKLILHYFSERHAGVARRREAALRKKIYLYPEDRLVTGKTIEGIGDYIAVRRSVIIQPSREELLRRILFLISAPAQRLMSLMKEPSRELLSLMGHPIEARECVPRG
jgi:hypothetical protein